MDLARDGSAGESTPEGAAVPHAAAASGTQPRGQSSAALLGARARAKQGGGGAKRALSPDQGPAVKLPSSGWKWNGNHFSPLLQVLF